MLSEMSEKGHLQVVCGIVPYKKNLFIITGTCQGWMGWMIICLSRREGDTRLSVLEITVLIWDFRVCLAIGTPWFGKFLSTGHEDQVPYLSQAVPSGMTSTHFFLPPELWPRTCERSSERDGLEAFPQSIV